LGLELVVALADPTSEENIQNKVSDVSTQTKWFLTIQLTVGG
jgi:hypothetical protein